MLLKSVCDKASSRASALMLRTGIVLGSPLRNSMMARGGFKAFSAASRQTWSLISAGSFVRLEKSVEDMVSLLLKWYRIGS